MEDGAISSELEAQVARIDEVSSEEELELEALDISTAQRQRTTKSIGDRILYEGSWSVGDSEISWRVGTVCARDL